MQEPRVTANLTDSPFSALETTVPHSMLKELENRTAGCAGLILNSGTDHGGLRSYDFHRGNSFKVGAKVLEPGRKGGTKVPDRPYAFCL